MNEIAVKALRLYSEEFGAAAAAFLGESTEQLKMLLADFKARKGEAATLAEFETYVDTFRTLVTTGREIFQLKEPDTSIHQQIRIGHYSSLPQLPENSTSEEIIDVSTIPPERQNNSNA